jgi:type IV pilus assembly protein PilN
MIKVNLLPRRVTKKKLTVIRHLVLGSLLVLVLVAGMGYWWIVQAGKISSYKDQVAQAEQEKDKLKNVNQEKEQHQKTIQDLKHRIDVIAQIEKGRIIPIHLLDEMTRILDDSLPAWLTNFGYNGTRIQIDGYAFTNPDIARLVKRFEDSPYLKMAELIVSQKMMVSDREIFRFTITAEVEGVQGG